MSTVCIRDVGAKSGAYEQECVREQSSELNRTHEPSSELVGNGDENSRRWKSTSEERVCGKAKNEERRRRSGWNSNQNEICISGKRARRTRICDDAKISHAGFL